MKLEDLGSDIDRRAARRFVRDYAGVWMLNANQLKAIELLFAEVNEEVPSNVRPSPRRMP